MELKTLQDWVVFKHLMSVPNVAAVSSFGGETKEYQVQLDPDKLVAYGLSLANVEQALAANNMNGGGSYIERGQQAFNVRAVGLMQTVDDIGATVVAGQERHAGPDFAMLQPLSKVPRSSWARSAEPFAGRMARCWITTMQWTASRAVTQRS